MRLHRRSPPELPGGVLLRARLLSALVDRFGCRAVVVQAPAGFGKTTLLAQALHENALAPRGIDAWLSCEPADSSAAAMLAGLADAVGVDPDGATVSTVVDAVLARAPLPVALVIDDVHEVPAGSGGAGVLADLLENLPGNGHLVLAGRTEPPVRLARLEAAGAVRRVGEADLRLTDAELDELAALNGVPADHVAPSGGWPALASLHLRAGPATAERFVWEEVLERLEPPERVALAALVAVDGADQDLAEVMLDEPVELDALAARVPLLERRASTIRPHALWRNAVRGILDDDAAGAVRRRAAERLRARGDLPRAASLLLPRADDDADWAVLREVIADCCTIARWVSHADLLSGWWSALSDVRRDEPAGMLLRASIDRLHQVVGEDTRPLLEKALDAARSAGERRVELAVLSHLGHVAWWHDDLATLSRLFERLLVLDAEGWPEARGPVAIGRAMLAQLAHDHERMLAEIERVDRSSLDPGMAAGADWLHVRALVALGRAAEGTAIADRAANQPGFAFQAARTERVFTRWFSGRMLDALALLEDLEATGERLPRDRFLVGVVTAGGHALLGRADEARRCLDVGVGVLGSVEGERPRLFVGYTRALIELAGGDEDAAAQQLRDTIGDRPFDVPLVDTLRVLLGVAYVLLPERRDELLALPVGPDQRAAFAAAAALVDVRDGRGTGPVDPERAVAALGLRWALELACRTGDAAAAGFLVGHFEPQARPLLRTWAGGGTDDPALTAAAGATLRSLPVPPSSPLLARVLGPVVLERDGTTVEHPDWRRARVRSLLLLLVVRRRLARDAAIDALWPDLDADAGAGNLRVTLRYLHKVLEPERRAGDATWFVRTEGDTLVLVDDGLRVDAWELETLLDEADALDASGSPSAALPRLEAALELWRGDYMADVDDDWVAPERERLRARFVAASVRAGELLVAGGDIDRALRVATRAVEIEPWSEAAHRVVMAAHLARGDRAAARRALARCAAALDELGVAPDEATVMLERSILLTDSTG